MPCNTTPTGCAPTSDCPPLPDPILPRCDVALPDGVFVWASITVENGCIVAVQEGRAPLYQPDSCCATPGGGGGGGGGLDGPPGPPGTPASVTPGQVFTIEPGLPARVENVGTSSNAILEFYIPRGVPGQDASNISGVTVDAAGIVIETGLVKEVPLLWPPVLDVMGSTDNPSVQMNVAKGADGRVTVELTGLQAMQTGLQSYIDQTAQGLQDTIDGMQAIITQQQTLIDNLTTRLNACCPP